MVTYSIKDVENLCGIKSHTLRIWEKRYGILKAKRTETNIRYYTEEDLRHALNISILYNRGLRISKIAKLSDEKLLQLVQEETEIAETDCANLDILCIAMLDLNSSKFNRIIEKYIETEGFDYTMNEILYPLLDKISMMWMTGSIGETHEKFVIQQLKRKILNAIHQLGYNTQCKGKFLLFLPVDEKQSLSLLYLEYLLKKSGFEVYNMDQNISLSDLKEADEAFDADFIFTILNDRYYENGVEAFVEKILAQVEKPVIISGYHAASNNLSYHKNLHIKTTLSDVITFVNQL